ncbi:MAG TPA: UDP-3-O-[3-hydroxymyristoyl] N-acetylglucosamine deacetylase [Alphaproteobacteria bacterium]|nr:UDP-3-O-[3-hydroxymyristoyl] N-acetylglucosamine deacetylase [Alphaproteobacteria bacterium]
MALQTTVKHNVRCSGVGLHSGVLTHMSLSPAPTGTGVVFRRVDQSGRAAYVPAQYDKVVDTRLGTTIANEYGVKVATIEHLMAAIAGAGLTNVYVDLDGPEVPIMDGSAAPFVFLIECAGLQVQSAYQEALRVRERVSVTDGDKWAEILPGEGFHAEMSIAFGSAAIGTQTMSFTFDRNGFKSQVARARTFGFRHEVEQLQAAGLALGGSLSNSIVIDGDAILNDGGLRFADEFVRHKLLDVVGDLSLAGWPLQGFFRGHKTGHTLNNKLLRELFSRRSAWEIVTLRDGPSTDTIRRLISANAPSMQLVAAE